MRALLLAALVLGASLSGCFGKDKDVLETADAGEVLDQEAIDLIESRAAPLPKQYLFPGQAALAPLLLELQGTVSTTANVGYEDKNDRGGNSYNTAREVFDLRPHVPPNQPVELRLTLFFAGAPGASADVDIYVDVPGTRTDRATDNNDEFNWKFSVQRTVVNTIALPDEPFEVGVQMSNGRSSADWPYTLRVEMTFPENVVPPAAPWAFRLPDEASGIVLSSEKAGGDEHVRAEVLVLDAQDDLVSFVEFDDLDIPTESVFVPLPGGQEYVVYALRMHGGFLRLESDVGLIERDARPLAVARERVVLTSAPSPGVGARDWLHDGAAATPETGGQTFAWAPTAFPLAIEPFLGEGGATVAWGEIRVTSSKGEVAWLQRVLRHDDERGSLGYTNDAWNSASTPANLDRGEHTVWVADVSAGTPVGFVVTTLVR